MTTSWKKIGVIGKPYGLRGAFYVGGRSNLLPKTYNKVVLGPKPEVGLATAITSYRIVQERAIVTLAAIVDRTSLNGLMGQEMWAPADIPEHEFSGLLGRPVWDNAGKVLGLVREFYNYGASDVVEITNEQGASLEIPFVEVYFEWDFKGQGPLRLKVPGSHFDELWTDAVLP